MHRYKSSDLAGLVARLESTADSYERTKSRRDTHRAMVETPSPKRDPRCDVDRRDELVTAEKAVDVLSLDLQRAAIAYVARLVRDNGDPDTAAGHSLAGYLANLEPDQGLARELTADELDMLWRVELAERFTSPTQPSRLTNIERCNILETLTVFGLVSGNPHRLTIAGRVELERAMPNRIKIPDRSKELRNIRTLDARRVALAVVVDRVIAELIHEHGKLPSTDGTLALIGAALIKQPELVGADSISVTHAIEDRNHAVRVRTYGVEVVRQ